MHRFYLPPEESQGETLRLCGDEAHHAQHVLRLDPGQNVEVLNGAGEIISCQVHAFVPRTAGRPGSQLELTVTARRTCAPLLCSITLIQALPKGRLFEDIIEKATELGVSRIVPLISDRVISRPEGEDAIRKTTKWRRTAIEALKQSGSAWLPGICPPVGLVEYLRHAAAVDLPLLASLQTDAREIRDCGLDYRNYHGSAPRSASLWIGPEGDFSPAEIGQIISQAGASPVSLGPWVLRTETAAIAGLAILNHEIRTNR